MLNALTIDVEDYFHVTAFEKYIRPEEWEGYPLRVVDNTLRILDMLDEYSIKSTFFILGWVAERCIPLVREIHRRGHELACHGYGHQLVYRIGPDKFREDLQRAKSILEEIVSENVDGYRAPSYSITKDSLWAFDILVEEGFAYDSSIFPVMHDIYGISGAERFPHEIRSASGTIKEFPLSTREISFLSYRFRLPVAGGGYLRLLPVTMIKNAITHINIKEKKPAVVYFHPWELDPGQPRVKAGVKSRFRHYLNLDNTEGKLRDLFSSLDFAPMQQILQ